MPQKASSKREKNWAGGRKQRQDEKNKHTKVKTKKQNAKKPLWIVSQVMKLLSHL
jgi:hypothetical protein